MSKVSKKQKRKNRRILLIIMAMFVTGILLSTSSYAWFTANKTVTISSLTVNVEAQNGIQVSVDGTNWKSVISNTDITSAKTTYAAATNQVPTTIEPVSSGLNVNSSGFMEMFYGTVTSTDSGKFILTSTKETDTHGTTGRYIAFDLFFKVDSTTTVYMTPNSGVKTSDATDTGIKNATRVAFVTLGHETSGATVSAIQALNAGTSSTVQLWEPNYDVHTAAAVSHALDTYGITTTQTNASRVAYDGIIARIGADAGDDSSGIAVGDATAAKAGTAGATYFKPVTPTWYTRSDNTSYIETFAFTSGVTKVRIYLWIEGQDVDCENGASGGSATFDLQFTTDLPSGQTPITSSNPGGAPGA